MLQKSILVAFFLLPIPAFAAEPVDNINPSAIGYERTVEVIDSTIESLVCPPYPNHAVCKRADYRRELAESIVSASLIYNLPPLIMTMIMNLESTFSPDKIGKKGEIGLTQVLGVAKSGCDLASPEGQIECGTKYLRYCVDFCWKKSLESGLRVYASGKCDKATQIAEYRMDFYERLVKRASAMVAFSVPETKPASVEARPVPAEPWTPASLPQIVARPMPNVAELIAAARKRQINICGRVVCPRFERCVVADNEPKCLP